MALPTPLPITVLSGFLGAGTIIFASAQGAAAGMWLNMALLVEH